MNFTNINLNFAANTLSGVTIGGVANTALTGVCRITGLLASAAAVVTAAELALRGCEFVLSYTSLKIPESGDRPAWVNDCIGRIRPYKDSHLLPLVAQLGAFALGGMIAHEAVRLAAGSAPAIYNTVLGAIGPFELNTGATLLGRAFGL